MQQKTSSKKRILVLNYEWPPLGGGAFTFLTSVILYSFSIVIDLLIKIHLNNSPHEKRYYVREVEPK